MLGRVCKSFSQLFSKFSYFLLLLLLFDVETAVSFYGHPVIDAEVTFYQSNVNILTTSLNIPN